MIGSQWHKVDTLLSELLLWARKTDMGEVKHTTQTRNAVNLKLELKQVTNKEEL
jgi:hypothetical protein